MDPPALLGLPPRLAIESLCRTSTALTVSLVSTSAAARCPQCGANAKRIHSRYQRRVADLPCGGYQVVLRLWVRRFFCPNSACVLRLFAERFAEFVEPYARRTTRLLHALRAIGFTVGGEAAARLTRHLHLPTSASTLLRAIKGLLPRSTSPVRVLGVDDWAWKKGQRYGTILVDLERHQVIDLLRERSSEGFAQWLWTHQSVEIISRDRGSVYIEGATRGAPHAQQVADRWHLLRNLREALEQLLDRHRSALQVVREGAAPTPAAKPTPARAVSATRVKTANYAERMRRRALSYARYEEAAALHARGLARTEIARRIGVSVRTISRYLAAEQRPRKRRSRLEPYLPYLRQRWAEGCHNASQLWRELRVQGFRGTLGYVTTYVWCLRHPDLLDHPEALQVTCQTYAPRKAVWLLLHRPEDLTEHEQADLASILQTAPEVALVYPLAQSFRRLIAHGDPDRDPAGILSWLEEAGAAAAPEIRRFAQGLKQDLNAVLAAFRLPWSQGQVEGQVNRLKTLKRQMYGRAGPLLLQRRLCCVV
jgi:transposase